MKVGPKGGLIIFPLDVKFGILFFATKSRDRCACSSVFKAAVAVEKYGFDSFWAIGLGQWVAGDPMIISAAAASNTRKLRMGICGFNPLSMYPARAAGALSMLDNISGGRLIVGIGSFPKNPFAMGKWRVPADRYDKPVGRMLETIELWKKLWTEKNVSYNGKFYKVENYSLSLKPSTKPHPPIWINGKGPRMLRITATLGNGWISGVPIRGLISPARYQESLTEIRRMAESAGRDPKEIEPSVLALTSISLDHNAALKLFEREDRRYLVRWGLHKELGYKEPWKQPEDVPLEAIEKWKIEKRIFGTPDECMEKIEKYIEAGVRHFIFGIHAANEDGFFNAIKLYGEKVIPYFKGKQ